MPPTDQRPSPGADRINSDAASESVIHTLFTQATHAHTQGDLTQARRGYQALLKRAPQHADALHLLGVIEAEQKEVEAGLKHITQAIQIRPNFAAYYINRGLIYQRRNQWGEAMMDYHQAVVVEPYNPLGYQRLGEAYAWQQDWRQAIVQFERALSYQGAPAFCHHHVGDGYLALQETARAIGHYQQALEADPHQMATVLNLSNAYVQSSDPAQALPYLSYALEDKTLTADNRSALYRQLGIVYQALEAFEEADQAFQQAGKTAEALYYRGQCYRVQGRYNEAKQCFQAALTHTPQPPLSRWALGLTELTLGHYETGWAAYEARWTIPHPQINNYHLTIPRWEGESLEGKRLFIQVEQGLGDTLQCLRYLPYLQTHFKPDQIVCESQAPLYPLLKQQAFEGVTWLLRGAPRPQMDVYTASFSLPYHCRTTLETIPSAAGYLRTPSTHRLSGFLPPRRAARAPNQPTKLQVGFVWAGNPENPHDAERSIPLSLLHPLWQTFADRITAYSLQLGAPKHDLTRLDTRLPICDLSPQLHDFTDTAVLLEQLDLLISVDTAIVHLAGALGKPAWVLLAHAADWRWLTERRDSPWYQSLRLFRQSQRGDWAGVLTAVQEALVARLAE